MKDWEPYFINKEIENELYHRVRLFIYSVTIIYDGQSHELEYGIDYVYLEEITEEHQIDQESAVLEFLSPGWAVSNIFIEEEKKVEFAEKTLMDSIRNVMEQKNFLNELYEKLPELIKNAEI